VDEAKNIARSRYFLQSGKIVDNRDYPLANTPCANVFSIGACIFPHSVQESFPKDPMLKELEIEGYMGEPLVTAQGETIGLLVALYKQEIMDPQLNGILFSTFASRLAAEMLNMLRAAEVEKLNLELVKRNQLLKEIGAIAKTGGWEFDVENDIMSWTEETFRIHGLDSQVHSDDELGLAHFEKNSNPSITDAIQYVLENQQAYRDESKFIDIKGQLKWIRTTGVFRRNEMGIISHIYGAFEDITDQKILIDKETDKANFLEGVLNSLQDAVVTVDRTGSILTANHAMTQMFGYTFDELKGENVSLLMTDAVAEVHDQYIGRFNREAEQRVLGVNRELVAKRKSGEQFHMELTLSKIVQRQDDVMIGIIRDLTERKIAERNLHLLAFYDSVTELPNLKSFEHDVRNLMGRASIIKGEICTLIVDINRFSQINLAYGSKVGDDVLRIIASRLKQCVGEQFKLYRGQNDTYIIKYTLPVTSKEALPDHILNDLQNDIKGNISREMVIRGSTQKLTGSIGVVRVASEHTNYEKLIMLLEYAFKEIKKQGEDSVLLIGEESLRHFERRKLIQSSIVSSLRNGDFFITLQPQFDVDNKIVTSEVLLRWNHPILGMIPPDEFIAIAEQTDDIILLSRWVIQQACQLIQRALSDGIETKIAINISGKHIVRPDFVNSLLDVMGQYSVPPSLLVLELTETILVSDISLVRPKIEQLSAMGVFFSIDDFGTGYSSLMYLRTLPIHELKIDRFFVEEIISEQGNAPIVNTIIEMARALGLRTVAEGVENEAQLNYLKIKGCNIYQGYFLAKPLPLVQWYEKLKEQYRVIVQRA
jgi:PAS domain S-box-containing protein/diguanylate cyclase (GGDEF)-like protein